MSVMLGHPELVIYHANCDDGFCAAWLHHRHGAYPGEYVAANYDDDPPDVKGRDVLIFDFSYPRDVLVRMHEEAESLLVFDHHKTAKEDLEGLGFCTFDMSKSGARLALEFLDPLDATSGHNWLVDYVEDRDMWWKKLPKNREVRAGLQSFPYDLEVWDGIYERGMEALAEVGRPVVIYQDRLIAKALSEKNFGWCWVGEHLVPCVNNTIADLTSDIVGQLAEHTGAPFAVGYFVLPDGGRGAKVVYNLRSRSNVDVGKVAARFGGGGHPKAAGFKLDILPDFETPPEGNRYER